MTRRVYVPIVGPNIGQSTWSHDPAEEERLPMVQLNRLRAELERMPGVINLTLQGGYGYADTPDTGMCVIATTDNDAALAERLARQTGARAVGSAARDPHRAAHRLGGRGGRAWPWRGPTAPSCWWTWATTRAAPAPPIARWCWKASLRHGARDCALTIRDAEVVQAALCRPGWAPR